MSLKTDSRDYIADKLGSSFIKDLGWRDTWVFIFQRNSKFKKVFAESHQKSPEFDSWAKGIWIRASVKREPKGMDNDCDWEDNESNWRRREFCQKYEGYDGVCRCK